MIDSRAEIHPNALIASDVQIGPWSFIGDKVVIDSGCVIGPHVVIKGPARIGKNNRFYQFSSIGEEPQDKKYSGEDTILEIGDGNVIREFCTLNRGTIQGGGITKIGHRNWIMAYAHIAHDCIVGNDNVLANMATLAGHVIIEDFVTMSGSSGVHQFLKVGSYSFVGSSTTVTKDVLPYVLVSGHEAKSYGLNKVGLKRRGFSDEVISQLGQAYKIIFRKGLTVSQALEELHVLRENCAEVDRLITALGESKLGILR